VRAGEFQLGVGSRRGEHLGANVGGDLDAGQADAAGCRVYQDPLAAPKSGQPHNAVIRGETRRDERRSLLECHPRGHRHHVAVMHGEILRVTPVAAVSHHAIACGKAIHLCRRTRQLHPRTPGRG